MIFCETRKDTIEFAVGLVRRGPGRDRGPGIAKERARGCGGSVEQQPKLECS